MRTMEKRTVKSSLYAPILLLVFVTLVSGAHAANESRGLHESTTDSPHGCNLIRAMLDTDGAYELYECQSDKVENRHYLFQRSPANNTRDEMQIRWRSYPRNSLLFGYCRRKDNDEKFIRAILPDDGKDDFVPIKRVLLAWEIDDATGKMKQIPKDMLKECFLPG
ncbi:MAG TPA: hypothetical protein VFF81_09680 [Noviherbaspirillum sp.]|nr:hypothetical protein [Noviherbaspirillum sp.]